MTPAASEFDLDETDNSADMNWLATQTGGSGLHTPGESNLDFGKMNTFAGGTCAIQRIVLISSERGFQLQTTTTGPILAPPRSELLLPSLLLLNEQRRGKLEKSPQEAKRKELSQKRRAKRS